MGAALRENQDILNVAPTTCWADGHARSRAADADCLESGAQGLVRRGLPDLQQREDGDCMPLPHLRLGLHYPRAVSEYVPEGRPPFRA